MAMIGGAGTVEDIVRGLGVGGDGTERLFGPDARHGGRIGGRILLMVLVESDVQGMVVAAAAPGLPRM